MATSSSVLFYITCTPLVAQADQLLDRLNKSNRQYLAPYGLPDVIQLAPGGPHASERGLLDATQRQWCVKNNVSKQRENHHFFVVADDRSFGPDGTVELVYMGCEDETATESFRAPIDDAVMVYAVIDGGQQGWEDFKHDADKNGGTLPKVACENTHWTQDDTMSGGGAEDGGEEPSRKLLAVKRPE
jgi:hypothetical protein